MMLAILLALQAAPVTVGQWTIAPDDAFCSMKTGSADGKRTFAVGLNRSGRAGFMATNPDFPHRRAETPVPVRYIFADQKPVDSDGEWVGDISLGTNDKTHGLEATVERDFLDRFAASREFHFAAFEAKGLQMEIAAQGSLTLADAKAAVAALRKCAAGLPKPKTP